MKAAQLVEVIMECPTLDGLVPREVHERLLETSSGAEFELLLILAFADHCASTSAGVA